VRAGLSRVEAGVSFAHAAAHSQVKDHATVLGDVGRIELAAGKLM
jgi:hypothetical protein